MQARLTDLSPHQRFLLYTLVQTATADRTIAPLEAVFIEQLAAGMGVDASGREALRAMLLEKAPIPNEQGEAAPDYPARRLAYRDAVHIAAVDGVIQPQERALLDALAESLALTDADLAEIWLEAATDFGLDEG